MSLIHQKLAAIASKIGAVPKHSENKDDKWKFRSIYDIYNQLQPLFKAEGVFLVTAKGSRGRRRHCGHKQRSGLPSKAKS